MRAGPSIASHSEAGLTLVEIVVALTIVSVMTSIAVLSVSASDRSAGSETEARRLAARITLASELALIEGAEVRLIWDERGYSLTRSSPQDGEEATPFGARHHLTAGVSLTGPSPAGSLPVGDSADQGLASFFLNGNDAGWRVDFDGLDVSVARLGS